jgi:predicted Zn finger-like uncharacterized protein
MVAKLSVMRFDCPTCDGHYKVVRAEVDSLYADRAISCRNCGTTLQGRGDYILDAYGLTAAGC